MKKSFEEQLEEIRELRNERNKIFSDIEKESKRELTIVILLMIAIVCISIGLLL